MTTLLAARLLMTAVLTTGVVASFILDWSANHLLSPLWHPHARFHGGLLLFMLAGVSATGLWMVWRKSAEPSFGIRAAALLALSFWTPLFYVGSVVPGASAWAGAPGADPRFRGAVLLPNMIVAAVFTAIIAATVVLTMKARRTVE